MNTPVAAGLDATHTLMRSIKLLRCLPTDTTTIRPWFGVRVVEPVVDEARRKDGRCCDGGGVHSAEREDPGRVRREERSHG